MRRNLLGLLIPILLAVSIPPALGSSLPVVSAIHLSGRSGVVIKGVHVTSTSGDCVQIINSSNITLENVEIGPCGTNNTTTNSRGVYVYNSTVNIYDSYIHVNNLASYCANSHDGISVNNSVGPVNIQGNVIAYNEKNIMVWDSQNVSVIGNFLLNPRGSASCSSSDNLGGSQFQSWADEATPNGNISVRQNYALSSTNTTKYLYPGNVSDQISFGVTNWITAQNNYVVGGSYANMCGITLDYKANNATISGNVISNTFHCGIGVASGTNHVLSGNKILLLQPTNATAVGLGLTGAYSPVPCGPVSVTGNISYAIQPNGWVQGYYNNGYCQPVTLTSNIWNQAAYLQLYPLSSTNPPPPIPPSAHSCVVLSPYSTNISKAKC